MMKNNACNNDYILDLLLCIKKNKVSKPLIVPENVYNLSAVHASKDL